MRSLNSFLSLYTCSLKAGIQPTLTKFPGEILSSPLDSMKAGICYAWEIMNKEAVRSSCVSVSIRVKKIVTTKVAI